MNATVKEALGTLTPEQQERVRIAAAQIREAINSDPEPHIGRIAMAIVRIEMAEQEMLSHG